MNIGIDIKALCNGKAGIAMYITKILDRLQEIDHENHYFLFEKQSSSYRIVNPRWKKIIVSSRLPGTLWLMFKLPFHFSGYSLDVFWGPEQVIPCVVNPGRVKMVSTIHDVAVKQCPETMQPSNYLINRIFLRRSIGKSSRVLAVSGRIRDDIRTFFPKDAAADDVIVTYEGGPVWACKPGEMGMRGDHLLFVGSFEPRKNLLNLLRALSILITEKKKKVALRIVGPCGWKNARVRGYIEQNGLAAQVSFLGYIKEKKLTKEYCGCKAFVYPSIYEGFGLPVLEALSAGAPVLTSKGTAMEEIAGECCVLFDPGDPHDIAEKILSVYQPDFNPDSMLRRREAVLARFSWDTTARKTLEVLKEASKLSC
jgi:glycosyltransferase involved in cell wall biosynthesis